MSNFTNLLKNHQIENFKYYALWIISQFLKKVNEKLFSVWSLFQEQSRGSAKRHARFDCIFDLPGPLARVKRSPKLVGCSPSSPSSPPHMSTTVSLGIWRPVSHIPTTARILVLPPRRIPKSHTPFSSSLSSLYLPSFIPLPPKFGFVHWFTSAAREQCTANSRYSTALWWMNDFGKITQKFAQGVIFTRWSSMKVPSGLVLRIQSFHWRPRINPWWENDPTWHVAWPKYKKKKKVKKKKEDLLKIKNK